MLIDPWWNWNPDEAAAGLTNPWMIRNAERGGAVRTKLGRRALTLGLQLARSGTRDANYFWCARKWTPTQRDSVIEQRPQPELEPAAFWLRRLSCVGLVGHGGI